ncbi:MAG: hypothetical protein LUQ32_05360 [Methanomicrobiales archaeon]|nr:hypothetical protein [Methanomicrobiales archaeon]
MVYLRLLAPVLIALVVCSIFSSGCTGQKGETQPPASTLTIATTKPVTPVPATSTPVRTGTPVNPVTPIVTPVWTPGTISQGGAAILIQGDIVGLRSAGANFIDELRFTVVKSPRAEPVTFEIPSTQIIFTKFERQFGTNYQILSGDTNGDLILDEGETFVVQVSIPPPYEIYAGQKFTMAIKNPPLPQITVVTQAPPVFTTEPMVLARAAS